MYLSYIYIYVCVCICFCVYMTGWERGGEGGRGEGCIDHEKGEEKKGGGTRIGARQSAWRRCTGFK